MKRALPLFAIVLAAAAHAQVRTGKVIYEEAMHMPAPDNLPADAGPLRDLFAQGLHSNRVLSFNPDASLYKTQTDEQKQMSASTADGAQIQFKIQVPEESTYTDLKTGALIEQKDLMGRKFLLSGDVVKRAWKMTGKQKTVLNYPCQEAIGFGKDTVTAWFTTAIPVSAGPQNWRGLPGLILEGSIGRGKGNFTIKAIKVEEAATVSIAPPKDGKKVTRDEFAAIEKEKEKEMEQQYGGPGSRNGNGRTVIHMER